jgi:hypothetical protein
LIKKNKGGAAELVMVFGVISSDAPKTMNMVQSTPMDGNIDHPSPWVREMTKKLVSKYCEMKNARAQALGLVDQHQVAPRQPSRACSQRRRGSQQ